MLDLFREIARRQSLGETVAVATIVRASGSTPREVGAKMVVTQDGKVFGTIGGGYGEHKVWKAAAEVIRSGQPRLVRVELTVDVVTKEGAVCGGNLDIFVEPIGPSKTRYHSKTRSDPTDSKIPTNPSCAYPALHVKNVIQSTAAIYRLGQLCFL